KKSADDLMAAARQSCEQAHQLVELSRDLFDNQLDYWLILINVMERQGEDEAALALLNQAKLQMGDGVALRLAFASHWLRQLSSKDKENKDAAEKSLAELEKGSEQFSISDRLTLLSGLAQVHERAGHIRDAKRLWTEVSKDDHDVGLSQRLNSRLRL